jgi:hypothetical protein
VNVKKPVRWRLHVGLVLAAIGVGALVARPDGSSEPFDGMVAVVPGETGVQAHITVSFEPNDPEDPTPGEEGQVSVSLTNDRVTDGSETHWYVFLAGDAILDDAQVASRPNEPGRAIDGPIFDSPLQGDDAEIGRFQVFDLTGSNQVRLVGTPHRSPIQQANEGLAVTMPKVLTSQPTEDTRKEGGIILVEEPELGLILANPGWVSPAARGSWNYPASSKFLVSSGLSQSSKLLVEQSVPELNRDKWASSIIWESKHPFEASATLLNPAATQKSADLSSISFLFFGAALPLILEGLLHRSTPSAPGSAVGGGQSADTGKLRTAKVAPLTTKQSPAGQRRPTSNKGPNRRKRQRGGPKAT